MVRTAAGLQEGIPFPVRPDLLCQPLAAPPQADQHLVIGQQIKVIRTQVHTPLHVLRLAYRLTECGAQRTLAALGDRKDFAQAPFPDLWATGDELGGMQSAQLLVNHRL